MLAERGMAKMHQDAPFAVFDTMGLDRKSMTKEVINYDLTWLVDGRVRTTCEMKWKGYAGRSWNVDGDCYQPWNEPPDQRRALHALLFVTRFYPTDSNDFDMIKRFIQDLRRMLHEKQKELVVAVTHLEKCDKTLSAEACKHVYERELGIGKGNVVVLSATRRVPPYAIKATSGLDGNIVDEQSATDGVYLEPDALVQLTTALQTACGKAYEQQLNFNDEVAALAASDEVAALAASKYIILSIITCCCWHWWHGCATSRMTFSAMTFILLVVIVDWRVYHSRESACVVFCTWFLMVALWIQRMLQKQAAYNGLWKKLAGDVTNEAAVRKFVARRQKSVRGPALEVESAVRVVNEKALRSFLTTGVFDIKPPKADNAHLDTLLFHGTSEDCVPNIQATGRPLVNFSKVGMLGKGIYGAPDPRKAMQY